MNIRKQIVISIVILGSTLITAGQVSIKGKVFDESGVFPIESVSVLSNSKVGTSTDISGSFELTTHQNDSIWFSYLGKHTSKFCVADIMYVQDFAISIKVPTPILPGVTVTSVNYRLDSINNRINYQKFFNYQNPSFSSIVKSISVTGFVVDLNELIRLFMFKEKKKNTKFRDRLISDEQQKFIARKFNKLIIREIIDISDQQLADFIRLYNPTYLFTCTATEYDMKKYIIESYEKYTLIKK